MIPINAYERIASLVKRALETDDNELEVVRGAMSDVVSDFGDVGVVEGCVNLIEDEERGGLVTTRVSQIRMSWEMDEIQTYE